MKDTIYLIFSRRGVQRMVKRGPPKTKADERFVPIVVVADDALFRVPNPQAVTVKLNGSNTPAPPVQVDLGKVPGVCLGRFLPRHPGDGKRDVEFACTDCAMVLPWRPSAEEPHWAQAAPAAEAKKA